MRLTLAALALLAGCGARTEPADLGGSPIAPADGGVTDAGIPGVDAPFDAAPACEAGTIEVAYVLDGEENLYRYDPQTGQAILLGPLSCGDGNVAWTMTATRDHAYVVYTDWTIYVVDLATLVCTPTAFQAGQLGLEDEFGVAAVPGPSGDRIFYYGTPSDVGAPILAVSDTQSFELTEVGSIQPPPPAQGGFPVNLTSDGNGHLYAYSPLGLVQEIDEGTGNVLQSVDTRVTSTATWATIAYGSTLYLWADTEVFGYDLGSRRRTSDFEVGIDAIGASAVTVCAGP
ncbi:MAG TPA: hypothetical protein VGG39_06275 [Polyangiaceae bacterium]